LCVFNKKEAAPPDIQGLVCTASKKINDGTV
ncbi:hypothetical protein EVA_21073, partial [gut metagenome]